MEVWKVGRRSSEDRWMEEVTLEVELATIHTVFIDLELTDCP